MKVQIRYASLYRYPEAVSFSSHLFRLIPRPANHLRVHDFSFHTNADAAVHWRRDLFDNEVARVFYPSAAPQLEVRMDLTLMIEPVNAFGFLLEPRALNFPVEYEATEQSVLAVYRPAAPSL